MIFKQIREVFIFTSRERNGLLILILLLFLAICLDFSLPYLLPDKVFDTSGWRKETEEYYAKIPTGNAVSATKSGPTNTGTRKSPGYLPKDSVRSRRFSNPYREKKGIVLVEINQADSAQLEALPGIGPVLASRIIKYRKLLGGFYEVAQLKEIYGMTEELWSRFSSRITADPAGNKKLELNFLSLAELGRHPYIGFRQAKKIIKRRDTFGKFENMEDLALLFSRDSLQRLQPYLSPFHETP